MKGFNHILVPLDFADTESHPGWVEQVIDRMGGLDVVVVAHGALGDEELGDLGLSVTRREPAS